LFEVLLNLHIPSRLNRFVPSSSSESITYDLKVILDFFLGDEVIGLGLNLTTTKGVLIHQVISLDFE
jgi:hypothetical protein